MTEVSIDAREVLPLTLTKLEGLALGVRQQGGDTKWRELGVVRSPTRPGSPTVVKTSPSSPS